MTTPQPISQQRCAGKIAGTLVHSQCRNCQRRTTAGNGRIAHFLPPQFVNNICPMRVQS